MVIGVHRRAGCTGRVAVVVVAVVIVLVLAVSGRVSHYRGGDDDDHASGTIVVVICGPGPHRGGAGDRAARSILWYEWCERTEADNDGSSIESD